MSSPSSPSSSEKPGSPPSLADPAAFLATCVPSSNDLTSGLPRKNLMWSRTCSCLVSSASANFSVASLYSSMISLTSLTFGFFPRCCSLTCIRVIRSIASSIARDCLLDVWRPFTPAADIID